MKTMKSSLLTDQDMETELVLRYTPVQKPTSADLWMEQLYSLQSKEVYYKLLNMSLNHRMINLSCSQTHCVLPCCDSWNSQLMLVLKECKEPNENKPKIIFCWIPSHIGITGNEAAEQQVIIPWSSNQRWAYTTRMTNHIYRVTLEDRMGWVHRK